MRILIILVFLFTSCIKTDQVSIQGLDRNNNAGGSVNSPSSGGSGGGSTGSAPISTITNVAVSTNQLVIDGANLLDVTTVNVDGPSGFNESFTISSKTTSKIIAASTRNISFLVGAVFNLVLSNAYGAVSFQVTFTLNDGAVTGTKIAAMGANNGEVLTYNSSLLTWEPKPLTSSIASGAVTGTMISAMGASDGDTLVYNLALAKWEPKTITSAMTYKGAWNPVTNIPPISTNGLTTFPAPGDFYIVSTAGTGLPAINGITAYNVSDKMIFDGSVWQKVGTGNGVSTFNTRQGAVVPMTNDYTWNQINKAVSSIDDITDIDTSSVPPGFGYTLKWNGTKWTPAVDLTGSSPNAIASSNITDGSLATVDFAAGAIGTATLNTYATNSLSNTNISGTDTVRQAIEKLDLAILKDNMAATTSPGTAMDASAGYSIGSRWVNTAEKKSFVLMDSTNGAAVWKQVSLGGWLLKNTAYTAIDGDKVQVDTSVGAVTITLPVAPIVGSKILFLDVSGTFLSNNLTVAANGKKIMGLAEDMTVSDNNISFGLIYVDATRGWRVY